MLSLFGVNAVKSIVTKKSHFGNNTAPPLFTKNRARFSFVPEVIKRTNSL